MSRTNEWVKRAKEQLDINRGTEDKQYKKYLEERYRVNENKRAEKRDQRGCFGSDWKLTDLSGKSICIIGEDEIGDEVLTIGCLPQLFKQSHCASVIWAGNPKLNKLFTTSFAGVTFVSNNGTSWNTDGTIYSWELIGRFRETLDDFSWINSGSYKPYIRYFEPLRERLRARYLDDSRVIIGLAWRSERNGELLDKTCGIRDESSWWEFFNQLKGKARFISLQYGDTQDEIDFVKQKYGVEIYQDNSINVFNDVDAAAAQIAAIDYVISISTTTAHLAGALGIPGWIMLKKDSYPHWKAGKNILPWYPTLRPIRQKKAGDWQHVLETIRHEVTEEI